MKKSKHFRKDVIMARVIAAVILVVLIALIVFVGSLFTKPSADENKDSQNTEHTQNANPGNQDTENENTEPEDTESLGTEGQNNEVQGTEIDTDAETDTNVENKTYVETTAPVRHRKETSTDSEVLALIDRGTKLEVLETLDGWYKVSYNGKDGYVSADFARVVEE